MEVWEKFSKYELLWWAEDEVSISLMKLKSGYNQVETGALISHPARHHNILYETWIIYQKYFFFFSTKNSNA